MSELEPGPSKALLIARELREVADVIESCPELADLDDPLDAAQRMMMDLDSLGDVRLI